MSHPNRPPAWLRELDGALGTNAQFVLFGNIRDQVLSVQDGQTLLEASLVEALWTSLSRSGYQCLFIYDPVGGLSVYPEDAATREAATEILGRSTPDRPQPMSLEKLQEAAGAIVHARDNRGALVIDYASRLAPDPQHLSEDQHAFFSAMEQLSHRAVPNGPTGDRRVPLFNPVVWLVNGERDLPGWLLRANDALREIAVPLPDLGQREVIAELLGESFDDFQAAEEDERRELVERFAQQTDGMTINAMVAIATIAADRDAADEQPPGMRGIDDAARCYRVGILDNPWKDPAVRKRIADGERQIGARVIGQKGAVEKSLDILMRSATGLTGAHGSPHATRPRGVLFFAGPTGVGKTELAKQVTRLVFGEEQAYTRFDMSEFSAEHSAARLIGAPPGYTGFDAGGELTNAVRERPFSLILFDEIEKAHGRILDKFLQVLEDGRLTDGRGGTVFFSEAILVFTSNLGIYTETEDDQGRLQRELNVTPEMDRFEVEERIRAAINDHFRVKLGRPELLNRFGDNIVVFDFIDREVGQQIVDVLLSNIAARVEREHKARLEFEPGARGPLVEMALENLDNGGRGIGSVLENALVNPLARALFARPVVEGESVRVQAIKRQGRRFEVELA